MDEQETKLATVSPSEQALDAFFDKVRELASESGVQTFAISAIVYGIGKDGKTMMTNGCSAYGQVADALLCACKLLNHCKKSAGI